MCGRLESSVALAYTKAIPPFLAQLKKQRFQGFLQGRNANADSTSHSRFLMPVLFQISQLVIKEQKG